MRKFFTYHTASDRACVSIKLNDFEPLAEFTREPVDGFGGFVESLPIKIRYKRKGFDDFVPFDPLIGVFSKRSLECFEQQVSEGEIDVVDLSSRGLAGLFAFNVLRTLEISGNDVSSDSCSDLMDVAFFRSALLPWSPIFVTRKFLKLVSHYRLTGCHIGLPDAPFEMLTMKPWDGTMEDVCRFE